MLYKFLACAALASLAVIPVRGDMFNVTVGNANGTLRYDPEFVNANPGDIVQFVFQPKNHTVTQSTFAAPCEPMENGFDSGFVPVSDVSNPQLAQFTVQDTNPVWVYCRQTGHCVQGMVFAINPGEKFSAFQAAAMAGNSSSASASVSATATAPALSASVVTVTATVTASGQTITTTYGSYPGSAAPTAASSADHQVMVGANGALTFSPPNITAQVGDTITFQFAAKNHTVTQSSFAAPCEALANTASNGQVGFDSGFMPVAANASNFPSFTITVNDTTPIWVYCKQTGHCGLGMVFSANAIESGSNNFAAFQSKAKQINGTSTSPTSSSASGSASATQSSSAAIRGVGVVRRDAGVAMVLALAGVFAGALLL